MPDPQRPVPKSPPGAARAPVTGQVPRPVAKSVTRSVDRTEESRTAPMFAEDADDQRAAPAAVPAPAAHPSAVRNATTIAHGRRLSSLRIQAAVLGFGLLVVLVLWILAWMDGRATAAKLVRVTEEAAARQGELERATYDAELARVRNCSLVLAYTVDQLDASRVAGNLKGGGLGILKEASEALAAVAHAQTGLTGKINADLKIAYTKMKEQKISPALDKAISGVVAAGLEVAASQEKALAGLDENELDRFAASIAKVRATFTKAYQELAEVARF